MSEIDCYETDFRRVTEWSEKGQHVERTEPFEHQETERMYIRGSSWIRGGVCSKGKLFSFTSYLLMYILMYILVYSAFTGVCVYSYIIFLYVCFLILCHVFFDVFDRKRWEHVLILELIVYKAM